MFRPLVRSVFVAVGLLCGVSSAQAAPILATLSGVFGNGPLIGTDFTASFAFDAPVFPPGSYGVLSDIRRIRILVGGQTIYSATNPGFSFFTSRTWTGQGYVWGPDSSEFFGPLFSVPFTALPTGFLSWSFSIDPVHYYEWSDATGGGAALDDCSFGPCSWSVVVPPGHSIPEPSSLFLALSAIAGLSMRFGVRSRLRHGWHVRFGER
jgi:hypothetical protein